MNKVKLKELANIELSNVDKKINDKELLVTLCNFVDVYKNWAITNNISKTFMKATATKNEIKKFTLKKGYIAITKDSETRDDIGISTYIADNLKNTILGYHCALIKLKNNELNGKYLNAVLHSQMARKYFANNASGSGQRYTLTVNSIENFPIPLINLDKQKKIGNLLSNIDKKIELNNKINDELEAMAKTIYDYWFLQFEFSNEKGKPYKSSGGKMVWNEELKREIPEGWEVVTLEDFGTLGNGINYDKKISGDKEYKIVNVKNISDSTLLLDKEKLDRIYLPSELADKYRINKNDILIARSGIPGAIRVLKIDTIENIIYCGFIICLRLDDELYKNYLVYKLKDYENTKATTSGGTVMQNVNQQTLRQIKFPVPNEATIKIFNKKIDIIWNCIQKNINENQELTSLRDFLLPLLMNGQVGFK